MSQPHDTTAAAPARTQADLPPIEFLEWLIAEAQQSARAVQAYAGKINSGLPFDAEFDVLTQIGPAIRFLDAAMEVLKAHMPATEPPTLPEGVTVVEG
jgi:hypothetical protein